MMRYTNPTLAGALINKLLRLPMACDIALRRSETG
jgi:hypothetical protein